MNDKTRQQSAQAIRDNAAELAASRPHPRHHNNGEEQKYRRGPDAKERSYIASFTKGLPHDEKTGLLLNPPDFRQFVLGIQSGSTTDFKATPLGPANPPVTAGCLSRPRVTCDAPAVAGTWQSDIAKGNNIKKKLVTVRAWESQAAGLLYDMEGPDAQSVTMPPAPTLASDELTAEMAEVYLMALLRDTHFSQLRDAALGPQLNQPVVDYCEKCKPLVDVDGAIKILKKLRWFGLGCCDLDDHERARHRDTATLTRQGVFRGITPGENLGPYLSQFLLLGNAGVNGNDAPHGIDQGYISYGAMRADQRVRFAKPCKDYMTTFEAWLDTQNAADLRGLEEYSIKPTYRFITSPRDLATYVHYDALYEAYLNACLILLGMGAPLDPGLPFLSPDTEDKQQGFASFGGPHILSLVTEVATRALKAVRYQKFNSHRRLRPEALAGLIDRYKNLAGEQELAPVAKIAGELQALGLLDLVSKHNKCQNAVHADRTKDPSAKANNYFLPMAFAEGSPMHPSYGAGHATVAGACVTILKAFFDHGWELPLRDKRGNPIAYEPNADGSALVTVKLDAPLTVEGELNKVAANIAVGRDWAGVHYFTDYIESLRMGEQIALGILEEQRLCYGENFTMTVPLFDGSAVRI